MSYGIIEISSVPGRAEPSDKSEMVTQLLFGDYYTVLEKGIKFVKIKNSFDGYECWICIKQHTPISKEDFETFKSTPYYCLKDMAQVVSNNSISFPILMGSSLPSYQNHSTKINGQEFYIEGNISEPTKIGTKADIVEDAFMYRNTPYLWGGRSPFGIDCSGFTQMVYKMNNIVLPRDAYQQAELGEAYSFVEEAEAGDLAFFDNDEGRIVHVGILIGNGEIIHASGKVRIDRLDHQGIFDTVSKTYTHKLRVIKKIL